MFISEKLADRQLRKVKKLIQTSKGFRCSHKAVLLLEKLSSRLTDS